MRCLIVSKTWARSYVCVGALAADSTHLRLTEKPDFPFQPPDTPYEIGQVWEIDYAPCGKLKPPHVEDVLVRQADFQYVRSELGADLPKWVDPWKGHVKEVFDGKTRFTQNGSRYIQDDVPEHSVGFWIPDKALTYTPSDQSYRYGRFRMKYVGVAPPPQTVEAGKLVRVSLARWFKPDDVEDDFPERCYLQISGVY